MKFLSLVLISLIPFANGTTQQVYQPIIHYGKTLTCDLPDAAPPINSFENFTHLATDFGWMGPGETRIDLVDGILNVKNSNEWTGAWHSLAGLAVEPERLFDPVDIVGLGGEKHQNSRLLACVFEAAGHGDFRIELTDANRNLIWSKTIPLNSEEISRYEIPIPKNLNSKIKFLNWVAESDLSLKISSLGLVAQFPEISLEEWAFRISLAKLRRCHDEVSGFTRDRGHLPAGKFESIASTGMYALAIALANKEGLITDEAVEKEINIILTAIQALPKAKGFFPHFIHKNQEGSHTIYPGTEYSTVDTAIAVHSLLLASQILGLESVNQEIVNMISKMDFDASTDADGWFFHGFYDDAITPLSSTWRDWGGETALVLALEAMVPNREAKAKMMPTGQVYRGVGFIAEIQSLFYPHFDRPEPDLVSQISWPASRRKLLEQQITYAEKNWPKFQETGIFGLSAGESGMAGAGYTANGSEVLGARWIHPHYMLMSLALTAPELYAEGLKKLHQQKFLYPFGLPENIEIDLVLQNPMQGSLNASFETISAYHGWRKRGAANNLIDRAAMENVSLRKGISRFYSLSE